MKFQSAHEILKRQRKRDQTEIVVVPEFVVVSEFVGVSERKQIIA